MAVSKSDRANAFNETMRLIQERRDLQEKTDRVKQVMQDYYDQLHEFQTRYYNDTAAAAAEAIRRIKDDR